MTPTIGRIVHYRLSEQDAAHIRAQRDGRGSASYNHAYTGDVYPATVVRVHPDGSINLQVHLDGVDTLWVSSVREAGQDEFYREGHGHWCWPPRVDMTREGK